MISSTDWRWRPYPADAYDPPENDGGGVVRATGARRGDSTTALLTAAALAAGATATALGGVPVVAAGPAVVINELNYNPVDDNPAGEYVELYNRSGATVDIGGWCVDGIDYCYPAGATIAAGGYFAVWGAWFGGALSNGGEEIVLLDVLSLSLGVETQGGLFTRLIENNSTIPLKKTAIFTTVADNQTIVEIHVLQGERELAKFNRSLAKFSLVGIAPAPRGTPQIEVSFDMDANGILSVSARDKLSGREQAVRITPSTGLGKDEIDRMVAEAREFGENDRKSRELTELRNRIQARAAVLVRSYLALGSLLDAADQKMLSEALRRARELGPEDGDAETLGELLDLVEAGASRLSEAVMSSPGEGQGGDPGGTEKPETGMRNLMKAALDDMEHT